MKLADAVPKVAETNKGALYLIGGVSVLIATLTGLGYATEDLDDLFRDHQILSYVSVTLVLVGVIAGLFAGYRTGVGSVAEGRWLSLGLAALGAGLVVGAWAVLASSGDKSQPTVTAAIVKTPGATVLDATFSASGLRPDEDLAIRVEPLVGTASSFDVGGPIFSATVSPDEEGRVDDTIKVEIPPGNFRDVGVRVWSEGFPTGCYDEQNTTGCVSLQINRRPEEPQLKIRWRRGGKGRMNLIVDMAARDIPNRAFHYLVLARAKSSRSRLAEGSLRPSLQASFRGSVRVTVGRNLRSVCVVASTIDSSLRCPQDSEDTAWLQTTIPGRGS